MNLNVLVSNNTFSESATKVRLPLYFLFISVLGINAGDHIAIISQIIRSEREEKETKLRQHKK